MAALTFGFVSCSTEDDDDPEGAITGSNKNYATNYTNNDTVIYRATNTTIFKHLGELVKITINNQTSTSKDGVMGFIWDLRQSKDAEPVTEGTTTTKPAITESGYQNFFAIGLQWDKGTPRYYISKFFNVTDIQGNNFGASTTVETHKAGISATTPVEIAVKGWTDLKDSSKNKVSIASDGSVTFWVDIYPVYSGSTYGTNVSAHSSNDAGSYVVDIYASDPTDTTTTVLPIESVTIGTDVTGYTAKPSEGTLAVYANYQPNGKTLNGTWYLAQKYADADVVEE